MKQINSWINDILLVLFPADTEENGEEDACGGKTDCEFCGFGAIDIHCGNVGTIGYLNSFGFESDSLRSPFKVFRIF